MNILTWSSHSKDGALQIETKYGHVFSDRLVIKPILKFDSTDFYYNECDGRFLVDGEPMTDVQKAEIKAILNTLVPPLDWVKYIKSMNYNGYMSFTGWYVERFNDPSSGKPIPEDVLQKRALCRDELSKINTCTSIEQLEQLDLISLG